MSSLLTVFGLVVFAVDCAVCGTLTESDLGCVLATCVSIWYEVTVTECQWDSHGLDVTLNDLRDVISKNYLTPNSFSFYFSFFSSFFLFFFF